MSYAIIAKSIYCEDEILENGTIIVNNGIIEDIFQGNSPEDIHEVLDLTKYNIIPGLIDMHVHGGNGYDTMDCNFNSINEISKYLSTKAVTGFLPTTVTNDIESIKKAVNNVYNSIHKVEGAEILGSYVEGPYIAKEKKGAHSEKLIKHIDVQEISEIIEASGHTVKVMTIAPEKDSADSAIKYLVKNGIQVSIGHTNATYDETITAIKNGAKIAVHTFNGMRGFNHREPAILGAVLTEDEVYCELICDLVHVHPIAIDLLIRCKGYNKIVLMSDAMRASGLKDGEYMLGALKVIVKNSTARVESGSLAGSTTNMLNSVKNIMKLGIDGVKAVNMASLNPSRVLGVDNIVGSIKKGKIANLAVIDKEFNNVMTIIKGKIVYTI